MAVRDLLVKLTIIADATKGIKGVSDFTYALTHAEKATAALKKSAANLAAFGGLAAGAAAAIVLPLKASAGAFEDQQAELAHIQTALDGNASTVARQMIGVQRMARDISSASAISALAAEQSFYIAKSNMLSYSESLNAVNAANRLVIATTTSAAEAQEQMMPTTRTLTSLFVNFGGSLSAYADQLTKLQTQYSFGTIAEVTYALGYAAPAAKAAGIVVSQMNTALALLSAGGLHGAEAGTAFQAFVDKLGSDSKLAGFVSRTKEGGIDLQHTLQTFAEVFGSMSPAMRMRELAAHGLGEHEAAALSILINKTSEFASVNADLANSQGTAASKSAVMMATLSEKMAVVANQWTNFKVLIGEALAPSIGTLVSGLGKVLSKLTSFGEYHPTFMKFIVLSAAATSGILALGGAIALAGAAVAGIAATIGVASLLILPLAAGFGAIAAAAFLVYSRWGAIVKYVENINWRNVGMDILKGIGAGILSGLMYLTGPLGTVAKYIVDHFRGHSPPPLGPLHAGLGQIRIIETIAEAIRPTPMLNAIRRVAAATAFAVPMAIGAGAMPAAASTVQGPSASAGTVININVTCNFNGGASADFDAKKHAYEIVEAMHQELARRRRTEF